ncbi:MAG: XdhC family protein [Vicinamibacteraceae bacterium]
MASPFTRMHELAAAGVPFAVATVVRTQGSTPQVVGAKLVLTGAEGQRPIGTLGGGCVEADAIGAARQVLTGQPASLREYQLTEELAWNTGLVCGGTMWILAESGSGGAWPSPIDGLDPFVVAADAAAGGPPVAFVSLFLRQGRTLCFDGRALVLAGGRMLGTLGSTEHDERARDTAIEQMRRGTARIVPLDETRELLVEPVTSRPQLVIAGGGHVSRAIARQARLLDFEVFVIEDRPEFADPERFDGATVLSGELTDAIASFAYAPLSYLVVATRGHKLDADCVTAAVATRVPYIGLLGSRRKTILIADMLREQGVDEARLAAIHAPVGLDLGGRTPAEIALSVLAEITQQRYQGTGRPLREQ